MECADDDAGAQREEPPRRSPVHQEKFTSTMRTYLLSLVMDDWMTITDTRVDDLSVQNKRRVWAAVHSRFSEKFPAANKTLQQLKDLWKRHCIQFRKESREELQLDEDVKPSAVPNELLFQKLLEWLEANPGVDEVDGDHSPPPLEPEYGEPEQPPLKKARVSVDGDEELAPPTLKQEPASPSSRADTPSMESAGSAEDGSDSLDTCRKAAEILSAADKQYLIQRCIAAYDVIGSCRLDAASLRDKRNTWVEITAEYNRAFARNLSVNTVKGVWRRFLKQRRDELMKTLKLRVKEDVTELHLLDDMRNYLQNCDRRNTEELQRRDLPLYKQIQADVERRPGAAGRAAAAATADAPVRPPSQASCPELILSQLRRLAPAPPRPCDTSAATLLRQTAPTRPPADGGDVQWPAAKLAAQTAGRSCIDSDEHHVAGTCGRLVGDLSITVVEPRPCPSSGSDSRPPPSSTASAAPAPARPPPPLSGPAAASVHGATPAPLAAAGATTLAASLLRDKHRQELQQLTELHQLNVQHTHEKHQCHLQKARLETEILLLKRDYWRLQLERAKAGVGVMNPVDFQ